jgi:hypothetical protein
VADANRIPRLLDGGVSVPSRIDTLGQPVFGLVTRTILVADSR